MSDDEAFDLDASLRHALSPRTLVLDKTPQKPASPRKAMPGSGRPRNPTTPSRSTTHGQVKKHELSHTQTALSSAVLSSSSTSTIGTRGRDNTGAKHAASKKSSASAAHSKNSDAMSKMSAAVAQLRALRTQFPDLPLPDDISELTESHVPDGVDDSSANLFDDNDDLLPPFEHIEVDTLPDDDNDSSRHPFIDDEAEESREPSPAPLTQRVSRHGYQKDDFVVTDGSGDEDMGHVDPPGSGVDGPDDVDRLSDQWDIEYADDPANANQDGESEAEIAESQDVLLSDGEEDVRRLAPRRRIHKKSTSVDDMEVDPPLSPALERDASVYEEDLPGIPYPSQRLDDDPEQVSEEEWDLHHVITRTITSKTSRLYTFYRSHPNKDLQPAHLVTMAVAERKFPLLAAVYDNPVFRKSYREEDLIPFLKMLRFQSFGDTAMIGNIDPALFTTEPYTTTATTGRRLVWLENRRNVLNYTLGVCYSSNLRTPLVRTTKKGQIAQHSLLFGAHDQTYRLMAGVLNKVFAFNGAYSAGPVTYVPEIGNSALAFSTLPSKKGVSPVQWTIDNNASLESSPMSSVKAPVLSRPRAGFTVDTGVQAYTYPTPIFDGRGYFTGTPDQMNSLVSNPPTAKFFGDGHTEIPHNAICLVAHTINSWQNVPEPNQSPYPPSISLNIQHVVVLALPAVLSGLHVKQPSSRPGVAKPAPNSSYSKSGSLRTNIVASSSKTITAPSKTTSPPKSVSSPSKPVSSPSKSVSSGKSSGMFKPSSASAASKSSVQPSQEVLTIRLPPKPSSPATRQSTKQGKQATGGETVTMTSPVTAGVKRPRASTVAASPKRTRSSTAKKAEDE
ncbi:hypothetical protein BDZ89DRAFT_1138713 [Hymenopellis radicata]|nr:hypothetical protein BDZ89DRAFT_1138713 [Hymenopellis radicata]